MTTGQRRAYVAFAAFMAFFAFGLYADATKDRMSMLVTGDSVGTCLWLTGQDTMEKIEREYAIIKHAKAGGTTVTAYKSAAWLQDDPDVIIVFSGWCDAKNWGMSDAAIRAYVAKFPKRFPRSVVVWIDTRNIPPQWTWDGAHITTEGFEDAYPFIAKAIRGHQDERATKWLTVLSNTEPAQKETALASGHVSGMGTVKEPNL